MIDLGKIYRLDRPKIIVFGNHQGIIQSILDFDYLNGNEYPSIVAVVGVGQKYLKYFWGDKEILINGFLSIDDIEKTQREDIDLYAIAQSGRRVFATATKAIDALPKALGGMIFAEMVPESHSLKLRQLCILHEKFLIGPSSVGMLVAGKFKLGAIGGTLPAQIVKSRITKPGNVAIVSTSGGMINEIISSVARNGGEISFAIAVGGERFPITKPKEIIEQAMQDSRTNIIVYFGELGGEDEYEIAEYYKGLKVKKPIIAYIAGTVAESLENAPQFGHAKSIAKHKLETASAKKRILKDSGVIVADSYFSFEDLISKLIDKNTNSPSADSKLMAMQNRKQKMFFDRVSSDNGGTVSILGEPLGVFIEKKSLSEIALSMFLARDVKSDELRRLFDSSLRVLVDHGPQVSGAVNTMITARAGKDLTSSLAAGLLTIGPRFGGALNQAAENWFSSVNNNETPFSMAERMAAGNQVIPGIGHKKYRLDNPDPRITILQRAYNNPGKYLTFAREVELITTAKKANLILNIDGYIAASMLDALSDYEHLSLGEIQDIINSEFFNAIFVYARTLGLIAHHIEQKRVDDGLFRLPDDYISVG